MLKASTQIFLRSFRRRRPTSSFLALLAAVVGLATSSADAARPVGGAAGQSPQVFSWPKSWSGSLSPDVDVLGQDAEAGTLIVRALPQAVAGLVRGETSLSSLAFAFSASQSLEGYATPDDVSELLVDFEESYPGLFRRERVGSSHEGRPLYAGILAADDQGEFRPTVLFNSMHHAREVMTTEVAIGIMETLTGEYGKDPEITWWLNNYRIVVVPQVNPDGNYRVHSGENFWRKNAWAEENRVFGVDLNRNYPSLWGECQGSSGRKWSDTFRGVAPASEPETQAMMELVERFRPVFDISYHSFSEMIIFPYGCSGVLNSARDVFESVALEINKSVIDDQGVTNGYLIGTAPELLYNADGGDLDWQWEAFGVMAYTLEVNSARQGFQPDYRQWRDSTVERQTGGWKALIRRLSGSHLRGKVELYQQSEEHISYTVHLLDKNGKRRPFAGNGASGDHHFRLRSSGGELFHILFPGRYELDFFVEGRKVRTVPSEVRAEGTDLGVIGL